MNGGKDRVNRQADSVDLPEGGVNDDAIDEACHEEQSQECVHIIF